MFCVPGEAPFQVTVTGPHLKQLQAPRVDVGDDVLVALGVGVEVLVAIGVDVDVLVPVGVGVAIQQKLPPESTHWA